MTPEQRWALAWPHYDRLVRIARARLRSREDAEDVVMEAMLSCVMYEALDPERLPQLLTLATVRRCIDVQRAQLVARRAAPHLVDEAVLAESWEEEVCERAHAQWAEQRLRRLLAGNELAAAEARADGMTTEEIASRLGTTRKAAELSLRRARKKLLRVVAAAGAVVVGAATRLRRGPSLTAPAFAAVACVMAVQVQVAPAPATAAVPRVVTPREEASPERVIAVKRSVVVAGKQPRPAPPRRAAVAPAPAVRDEAPPTRVITTPPLRGPRGVGADPWTVKVDDEEPLDERLARCVDRGVVVRADPGGVGVVCRE